MKLKNKFTGERLESFIYNRSTIEHLHRYALASKYCTNKVVLDIASGEGYGTNILASNAKLVYGVDIDPRTVTFSSEKYQSDNLKFFQGTTSKIPLENDSVDLVVSFETIEHHDEHHEMMAEIKRVLKKDGILIISTPDKKYYSEERDYSNPFHVKEFYKKDFISFGNEFFENVQVLNQLSINSNSYFLKEDELLTFESYDGSFDGVRKMDLKPMFTTLICSDAIVLEVVNSTFNGNLVSRRNTQQQIDNVKKSTSFKIGSKIVSPIRKLRRIFSS